jgi:hypothetical protein
LVREHKHSRNRLTLAQARWEAIKLAGSLPEGDLELLERQPFRIRVIVN